MDELRREAEAGDSAGGVSGEGTSRPIHTSRGSGYAFRGWALEDELKLAEVREGFFDEAARFGIGIYC